MHIVVELVRIAASPNVGSTSKGEDDDNDDDDDDDQMGGRSSTCDVVHSLLQVQVHAT